MNRTSNDADPRSAQLPRRRFLQLMAASAALAGAGCSGPPQEQIAPYVRMPERLVPGEPVFYATSTVLDGYGNGVLVETNTGRPTKVEGNPLHPSSLGATDVFAQAALLEFWDPDRSQAVRHGSEIATWSEFEAALDERARALRARRGEGLALLTGAVTSPTLARRIHDLLSAYPRARWFRHTPLHADNTLEGARLAFGKPVDLVHRLDRARVVLSLDADFLAEPVHGVRAAHDYARARRAGQRMVRLYAAEATPGLTGANADHRLALPPHAIEGLAWRLARRLGVASGDAGADAAPAWEQALARDLAAHRGAALIIAGERLPPTIHALVHHLNERLEAVDRTLVRIERVEVQPLNHTASIAELARLMHAGSIDTLLMSECNPVYDAPADVDFAGALARVPFSLHHGLYRDETALRSRWHAPATHSFEAWGDARGHDGTAGIVQPVVAPLYQGRPLLELLDALLPPPRLGAYERVRDFWQRGQGDAQTFWREALRRGFIEDSAFPAIRASARVPAFAVSAPPRDLVVLFAADARTHDGRYANNAWLQELPCPLTKLTWDNAVLIGPQTAQAQGLMTGDEVELRAGAWVLRAPVQVIDGQAAGSVALPLGYGRWAAGHVGNGVGFNAYRLRTSGAPWTLAGVSIQRTGARHAFAHRQIFTSTEGRDIARHAPLAEFLRNPQFAHDAPRERRARPSLYPGFAYPNYAWGMAIDLNACIGCGACTIACQAENNIPVVGAEEVAHGREMHWIRVDRYEVPSAAGAVTVFQPVPCMHCEKAPCEEVCPVGATVHDSEGLNVQVYNRCVGTRFCSNNCPYKVRRFNWLQYSNTSSESLKAAQNPQVTVRRRGVMEKCSYCVQRISRARIATERAGRLIRDGEVITACQAVCPAQAIVFGDLNDANSAVNRAKASPRNYTLLAELSTQPRTTYLARVTNPNPELEGRTHG